MNKIEVIEKTLPQNLDQAYKQVRDGALYQIRSFKKVRSHSKIVSNILRFLSFILLCIGICIPSLSSLSDNFPSAILTIKPLAVGYAAMVLGGLCNLADQVFGFSDQHDRIRTVEMRFIGLLRDLDFEWSLRRAADGTSADPQADLKALYDFRRLADEANAAQVAEWITQRKAALNLLAERFATTQALGKRAP